MPFFIGTFIATPSPDTKLSCTQRPFGKYWASAMLKGTDFIAKLSDGLKIIDQIFITCDDIAFLSQV